MTLTAKKGWFSVLCWISTGILLAVLVFLAFGKLGVWHIEDYDEARHGVNAYEMIKNNDYLVHTFQGEPDLWNTKPPLSFWMISLSYRIFGYNAFALRFFSALATVLAVLILAIWAMKRYGKWAVPLLLLMFTANMILYELHFTRFGDADSQYQFFFTMAMLCLLNSHKNFKWLYGCGLFFSLAFLEKSIHALMIPAVCFFTLVFTGRLKELTWKRVLLLLASALTLVLVWVIARISRDGFAYFINSYTLDVEGRVGGGLADPMHANIPALLFNLGVVLGLPYVTCTAELFLLPSPTLCLVLCAGSGVILWIKKVKLSSFTKHAVITGLMWIFIPALLYALMNVKFCWYVYSVLYAVPVLTCVLMFTVIQSGVFKNTIRVSLGIFVALMVAISTLNVINIAHIQFDHTVQGFIRESLDRDLDSEKHAYILYAENGYSNWMPGDVLTAEFYGDLNCIDGGLDAFLADDENSLLFIARTNNEALIENLMAEEIIFYENYYCVAFEKF